MARRDTPEINAGSMADIAFLLLIFFLVTTTMDVDAGIARRLPEKQPLDAPPPPVIKERNVFEVIINKNDDLLIEGEYSKVQEVRQLAIDFIDNGGAKGNPMLTLGETEGQECDWCQGARDSDSSDHPNKAVISLKTDRSTTYGTYIKVQNELGAAYTVLRNRLSLEKYNILYTDIMIALEKDKKNESLKAKRNYIRAHYPEIISKSENQ
jgi:biopolymer transport protein ExbD